MKYIEIKNNGEHGWNLDAILANLGYCLSSTTDDDFYKKLERIGKNLAVIILNKYSKDELIEMFKSSISNSQYQNCSCVKNEYNINSCHIDYLSSMISSLSEYSNREKGLFSKYFDKNNIIDFFTLYFTIMKNNNEFKFLLEEPSRNMPKAHD